jgi:hypothetical protein
MHLKIIAMKSIRFIIPAIITGFFVALSHGGYASVHDQERQNQQERNQQEQQNQQHQDVPEGDDRTIAIDGLPQSIRDTLKSEYEDWIPVEASLETDAEEGPVYRIKMHDAGNEEAKIIKITRLGEIIDEQDAEIGHDEREGLQRGRQDQEGTDEQESDLRDQDRDQHMDRMNRVQQDDREDDRLKEQHMYRDDDHDGARDQARALDPDNLPDSVKDKIREDYKDWRPSEAFMETDPREGLVYKVKLENEEDEYKVLKITHDGEVLDEEDVGKHEDEERQHERRY